MFPHTPIIKKKSKRRNCGEGGGVFKEIYKEKVFFLAYHSMIACWLSDVLRYFYGYFHVFVKKCMFFFCEILLNGNKVVTLRSKRDNSSVGRALASQAEGRGFESRLSLQLTFET